MATGGKARCWACEDAHPDYLDMTRTYLCTDLLHPSGHRPNESQADSNKQHTALHTAHAQNTTDQQMIEGGLDRHNSQTPYYSLHAPLGDCL